MNSKYALISIADKYIYTPLIVWKIRYFKDEGFEEIISPSFKEALGFVEKLRSYLACQNPSEKIFNASNSVFLNLSVFLTQFSIRIFIAPSPSIPYINNKRKWHLKTLHRVR